MIRTIDVREISKKYQKKMCIEAKPLSVKKIWTQQ